MDKEQIVNTLINRYLRCENVDTYNGLLFCLVWWKHEECLMLEELLREITGDAKYDHPRHWESE